MKRASVNFDQSHSADDEAKEKFKYQRLLKEYLELQKEFVSRKRKLQAAKQKRKLTLAEVRFLRRKHKYLLKSQAPNETKKPSTLQDGKNPSTIDQLLLSNALPVNAIVCLKIGSTFNSRCHLALEGLIKLVKLEFMLQKDDEAEEGKADHVYEEDVRCKKKMKSGLNQDKVEMCWPGQVTLNVYDESASWRFL